MINKSRLSLIMLVAVFFGPFLAAWAVVNHGQDYIPLGKAARGELIFPTIALKPFTLDSLSDGTLDETVFKGRWTYVTISGSRCEAACQQSLYKMRQVRLTQGKNIGRVQRLIILTDRDTVDQFKAILGEHQGLKVVFEPAQNKHGILAQLDKPEENGIYLVDPLGNWFLQYAHDVNPSDMRKDLTKLMLSSQIG